MLYSVLYVVAVVFLFGVVSKMDMDWTMWIAFSILVIAWPMTLAIYVAAMPFVFVYRVGALCSEYIISVCEDLSEVLT